MINWEGRSVANQFIIDTEEGLFFQSYKSIVAFEPRSGEKTVLDEKYWDYSRTTLKYLKLFLGVTDSKKELESKINSGEYKLANLN